MTSKTVGTIRYVLQPGDIIRIHVIGSNWVIEDYLTVIDVVHGDSLVCIAMNKALVPMWIYDHDELLDWFQC